MKTTTNTVKKRTAPRASKAKSAPTMKEIEEPFAPFMTTPPMPGDVMDYFPDRWTPRSTQIEVIPAVVEAFESGKQFVVVEAPPGAGKTLIAATLGRYYGGAYVCTFTKQLQTQFSSELEYIGTKELKGRSSFKCDRARDTCDVGGILFTSTDACGFHGNGTHCPYRTAKKAALAAPITVCNYLSYLWNVGNDQSEDAPDPVRPLLVLDEAHRAEGVLLEYIGVELNENAIPFNVPARLPAKGSPIEAYFDYLEVVKETAKQEIEFVEEPKKLSDLKKLLGKISFVLRRKLDEEWIAEPWDGNRRGFSLKPLTVASFGQRLFKFGERVLLMSATILDHEKFCENLGIDLKDAEFIQAPCTFPAAKRQVIVSRLGMKSAELEHSMPEAIRMIDEILNHYSEKKGLILVPSNKMVEEIHDKVERHNAVRMLLAYGDERDEKYREHLLSPEPTVLVGSGLWEGADLKGALGRFNIIPKLPRAMWSGQIAARGKKDPRWYEWLTWTKMIQGMGRTNRSESDFSRIYVFDGDFRSMLNARRSLVPGWLRDAVVFDDA